MTKRTGRMGRRRISTDCWRRGAAEKDPRTRTIIGPWTHGGQEEHRSGEREFGVAAAIDYDELILRWMDHYVRGMDNGVGREKPVRIFVMGTERVAGRGCLAAEARARATKYLLQSGSRESREETLGARISL